MNVFDWPDYKEPIVIFGYPRSGTSITARILYEHGVWVGSTSPGMNKTKNPPHPGGKFEHNYLGKQRRLSLPQDVDSTLKSDGYKGGFWLVKRKINQKRINRWLDNGFNPYWILVRRNPDDIIASRWRIYNFNIKQGKKPKNYPPDEYKGIKRANNLMDYLKDNYNGKDIHPELFIGGDYSELRSVFEWLGIKFDKEIADKCVDTKLWKRKSYS